MLLGREGICARLDDLLASATRGEGGSLVLAGPAGIGKTALIAYAAARATGMLLVEAAGSSDEVNVPYAGLCQVLLPVIDLLPTLSSTHVAALSSALALGPPTGAGSLAVSMGCVNLLAAAARDRPVLVVVDDGQWLDEVSREVLTFAARRLTRDPVAIVMSFRVGADGPEPPPGLPTMVVDGLTARDSAQLMLQQGHRLNPDLVSWLVETTGGNPLAICDLPEFASPSELTAMRVASRPAPVGQRLEAAYGRAFGRLAEDAQRAALIVAILNDPDVRVVTRALSFAGLDTPALEQAEDAGLFAVTNGRVQIRHPLVRSAITQLARPSLRRSAHLAAAEGLLASTSPRHHEARIWHLAEAAVGSDESTATLLEELARRAAGQAGNVAASVTYERAAELSEGEHRVRRLVAAADAALGAGQSGRCRQLLQQAHEESSSTSVARDAITHLEAQLDTWSHDPAAAARQLRAQAQRFSALDPLLSIKLSVDATAAAALSGQLRLASELADSVSAITRAGGPATEPIGDLLVGSVRAMRGDGALALPLLDRCRAAFDEAAPSSDVVQQIVYLATSYHFIDAFDSAMPLFERALSVGRGLGAIGMLPFALAHSANSKYRVGDWNDAYADASEALSLAEDSGRLVDRPIALAMLGQIEAARGDERARERAQAVVDGATAVGARFVVAQGLSLLGLLELGLGRTASAVSVLERCGEMAVELGWMELGYLQWAAELVEASVLSETGPAEQTVQVMTAATHHGTIAINGALLARCRALVATDGAWEPAYEDALRLHELASRPFERARTQLCFGERLRRNRRRRDARIQLTAAWQTFSRLGAVCWAERAARELQAAGAVAGVQTSDPAGLLTPQEFQVARAAVAGSTNRQIADTLFLSQKTVEFHLSAIYRRLGLRSRSELATVLADATHSVARIPFAPA